MEQEWIPSMIFDAVVGRNDHRRSFLMMWCCCWWCYWYDSLYYVCLMVNIGFIVLLSYVMIRINEICVIRCCMVWCESSPDKSNRLDHFYSSSRNIISCLPRSPNKSKRLHHFTYLYSNWMGEGAKKEKSCMAQAIHKKMIILASFT